MRSSQAYRSGRCAASWQSGQNRYDGQSTCAAPCCKRQSVNPPVEAPTSKQARPCTSDGPVLQRSGQLEPAAAHVGCSQPSMADRRHPRDRRAGFSTFWLSPPRTRPARMSARARSRLGTSPRSTSRSLRAFLLASHSLHRFTAGPMQPCEPLARRKTAKGGIPRGKTLFWLSLTPDIDGRGALLQQRHSLRLAVGERQILARRRIKSLSGRLQG